MRSIRRRAMGAGAAVALSLAAACGKPPHAASTTLALTPEERATRRVLGPAEQAEVLDAMRATARGHVATRRPAPAPAASGGMRWSDLPAAVRSACDDVEAAVTRVEEAPRGDAYVFHLRTIEDAPGTLRVERVEGPRLYEASASVGRFPGEPKNVARAEALLAALARHMKARGAKRDFNED